MLRDSAPQPWIVGRYTVYDEIASGGMARVHLGQLRAAAGFSRIVAIKRTHPELARDPDFRAMVIDEARLTSRIRHRNVVPMLEVAAEGDELVLVMEYILGGSLAALIAAHAPVPIPVRYAATIVEGMLQGLHAAHEARSESGQPLEMVHRDVSPQNLLVGVDGIPRVLDFGMAKARARLTETSHGVVKGKVAYMSPEQLRSRTVDRRSDVYSAGVVLWEALVGKELFQGDSEGDVVESILLGFVKPPSLLVRSIPSSLDEIVLRALDPEPANRFGTAHEMALALEQAVPLAPASDLARWVEESLHDVLVARRARILAIESAASAKAPAEPSVAPGASPPGRSTVRPPGRTKPASRQIGRTGAAAALLCAVVGASAAIGFFVLRSHPRPLEVPVDASSTSTLPPSASGAQRTQMPTQGSAVAPTGPSPVPLGR